MTQQGSYLGFIKKALDCKVLGRLGTCSIAVTLFFTSSAHLVGEIRCQTTASQTPALHSNPSNSDNPGRQNETFVAPPNHPGDRAIPLPRIADRAEELDHLLREISNQLAPKSEIIESERKTAKQAEEIRRRAQQTGELLAGTPTPLELENEHRYWRSRSLEYGEERRLLTLRAAKLEGQIQALEAQRPEWMATWIQIRESQGIESVVERTKRLLDRIQEAKLQVQDQLNAVLTLQNQVSQQDQQISDILLRVQEARQGERGRLFVADNPPLWEARKLRQLDQGLGSTFRRSIDRSFATNMEFSRAHMLAIFALAVSYLLVLLLVFKLRRYIDKTPLEVPVEAARAMSRPFSVALLLTLIGTGRLVASAPIGIASLFYLLYLVPVLRILAPMIEPKLRTLLYVMAALYGLEGIYLLVQLPLLFRRELYALLVFTAVVSFGWLARPSALQVTTQRRSQRMLMIVVRGGLLLLIASLVGNIIGFISLAQVLGLIALVGPFVASALYCGARVLFLISSVILRTNWARALLDLRVDTIERWTKRLISLGAILLWLKSMLQLIALYDEVIAAASKVFKYEIRFQKIQFTLGDALGVPFMLLGGYFAAKAFTFLLKNVVLSKLTLQRGLPYAISTVTYYVLLVLVALAALSGAGIELNKFTVLTGALGVGLGFGLQNIVNNFVSGLILLFERPIHVGDTVDVGGLVGVVRRIGARSSTVVTFQGAEVIVPNSNLLSNQVVNWTLSSQWRRVDVPIRVAYGTDPERVIKLLIAVAQSHPGILLERPPIAFFMGFGESSLNFELRFWSAWQDTWLQLQSDVTVAVAKALREADIEIPFPQRDLHLRSFDAPFTQGLAERAMHATSTESLPEPSTFRKQDG